MHKFLLLIFFVSSLAARSQETIVEADSATFRKYTVVAEYIQKKMETEEILEFLFSKKKIRRRNLDIEGGLRFYVDGQLNVFGYVNWEEWGAEHSELGLDPALLREANTRFDPLEPGKWMSRLTTLSSAVDNQSFIDVFFSEIQGNMVRVALLPIDLDMFNYKEDRLLFVQNVELLFILNINGDVEQCLISLAAPTRDY